MVYAGGKLATIPIDEKRNIQKALIISIVLSSVIVDSISHSDWLELRLTRDCVEGRRRDDPSDEFEKCVVDSSTSSPLRRWGSRYLVMKYDDDAVKGVLSIPASIEIEEEWMSSWSWVKKQTRYSGMRIILAEIVYILYNTKNKSTANTNSLAGAMWVTIARGVYRRDNFKRKIYWISWFRISESNTEEESSKPQFSYT